MKKTKNSILSRLNQLLIMNCKTEKVFLNVLDTVENSLLKNFLRVAGYERNQFIKSLDSSIRQNGFIPSYPEGLLENDTAELSLNLKMVLSKRENLKVLNEIGKIQIKDIERYKKTINRCEFPESVEKSLREHLNKLITSLYAIDVHKDLLSRGTAPISA